MLNKRSLCSLSRKSHLRKKGPVALFLLNFESRARVKGQGHVGLSLKYPGHEDNWSQATAMRQDGKVTARFKKSGKSGIEGSRPTSPASDQEMAGDSKVLATAYQVDSNTAKKGFTPRSRRRPT